MKNEIERYIRRNRRRKFLDPCPFNEEDEKLYPEFCLFLFPEIKGKGVWDTPCREVSLGCPCRIFGKEKVVEKVRELFPLKEGENKYPWEMNT